LPLERNGTWMVKQNGRNNFQPNEPVQPFGHIDSARLDLIASAVTALGDILAVMAAALAIQEEEANKNSEPNNSDIERQLKKMQKQLDYLMHQVSKK